MAQTSITCYFNARKRSAVEDTKINRAKKVLLLDNEIGGEVVSKNDKICVTPVDSLPKDVSSVINSMELQETDKVIGLNKLNINSKPTKKMVAMRKRNIKVGNKGGNIQTLLNNLNSDVKKYTKTDTIEVNTPSEVNHVTPPGSPTKFGNAMDKLKEKSDGPSLKEIKRKMTRSARLAELKASIGRFQNNANQLKEIEKKTIDIPESPKLKSFRTIELEVHTSPQKIFSPEKQYLSPRKDLGAKRNLFNLLSPTKNAVSLAPESPAKKILEDTSKAALTLPYKYRYLAEIFRSIDTICQIFFNRKETITFKKLKPAVEQMLKRNLLEKHLSQIKAIYPDAYSYSQVKMKVFGAGNKQENWELVLYPQIGEANHMTSEILLERRRKLFNMLLEKVKNYHQEFLSSIDPPIIVSKEKLTRWHPEFDIERVPDIECSELPQAPLEGQISTGKDVLEKAKLMFNCNTRMEQALQRLKEAEDKGTAKVEKKVETLPESVLKGIPKALLEKVRQKQAAKALLSMTRSADQERELKIYSRLPEIARLTRNLFVSEKKSVLPLDNVVEKLGDCYKMHLTKTEMEEHLRVLSKEFPNWLILHSVRHNIYVKISKNDDLSLIMQKLENLAKQKK